MSQLNWTEAQWNRVNSAITEEFTKASVAGACLPCYGPVGASMEAVSKQTIISSTATFSVADSETTPFWSICTYVHLNSQQVADENLSSALYAFRRAASLLARTEDYLVFRGHNTRTRVPPGAQASQVANLPKGQQTIVSVITNKDHKADGLFSVKKPASPNRPSRTPQQSATNPNFGGEQLVRIVADAISKLEENGYPGPFACVLGQELFLTAQTPSTNSLVLPSDRITPMLGGPLLRSSTLLEDTGVVVSSCGESLDLVVATPPKAQFLQVNEFAKYVFRVYERFALRIKDPDAVVPIIFKLPPPISNINASKAAAKKSAAAPKSAGSKPATNPSPQSLTAQYPIRKKPQKMIKPNEI